MYPSMWRNQTHVQLGVTNMSTIVVISIIVIIAVIISRHFALQEKKMSGYNKYTANICAKKYSNKLWWTWFNKPQLIFFSNHATPTEHAYIMQQSNYLYNIFFYLLHTICPFQQSNRAYWPDTCYGWQKKSYKDCAKLQQLITQRLGFSHTAREKKTLELLSFQMIPVIRSHRNVRR